uniref:Uncharacterized protein n=1 Tax=Leersia perrieri TaxID=77586 RepID=A0A0D9W3E3_9ORYZ
MDEATTIIAASKAIQDTPEALGASAKEIGVAVREAVNKVKGHRLVMWLKKVQWLRMALKRRKKKSYNDYESKYSDDEEDEKNKEKGKVANGVAHQKANSDVDSGNDD